MAQTVMQASEQTVVISSSFLAHAYDCTLSDWFVILGPRNLKLHPSPQDCRDPALVLGFFSILGNFKRLPREGAIFTTNRGTTHLWRAALGGFYSPWGSDRNTSPWLSQSVCEGGHLISLGAAPLGDWRQLARSTFGNLVQGTETQL